MDLAKIRHWDTIALQQLEQSLSTRITTTDDVQERLADISRLPAWQDDAAEAARKRFQVTGDDLTGEAAALGAVKQVTRQTLDGVTHLKKVLDQLIDEAAATGMSISDAGEVSDTPGQPPVEDEDAAARENLRAEFRAAARALILQAEDIVADAADVLTRAANGEIEARGAGDVDAASIAGAKQGELTAPAPPQNGSPLENREYWDAMPESQRRAVIEQHPEWVGNRDGIPSGVRHEANVAQFDDERARLEAERSRLEEEPGKWYAPEWATDKGAALWYNEQKLKDLDALEALVKEHPDGRLMLLDLKSGERGMAAFALGDPDTADHISVTTPGKNTEISSLGSMADEGQALRTEAEEQLDNAGRGGETVSTIAWLGYQPPVSAGPGNIDIPTHTGTFIDGADPGRGWADAAQSDRATDGAPRLAQFYEGLDVASEQDDPHITALGHSYGSYTQGLALQDPGTGQPVDDAVFYGSPGFNANDEADLGLEPGHGYVMRAPDDPITLTDGTGSFGPDPVHTDLEQLSTKETTTGDGVSREDSNGHSEYPRSSGSGELRTSGYNMAVIVAGLPELAVR